MLNLSFGLIRSAQNNLKNLKESYNKLIVFWKVVLLCDFPTYVLIWNLKLLNKKHVTLILHTHFVKKL